MSIVIKTLYIPPPGHVLSPFIKLNKKREERRGEEGKSIFADSVKG